MQLTPWQRRVLTRYRDLHGTRPTPGTWLRRYARRWLFDAVFAAVVFLLDRLADLGGLAWLCYGLVLGSVLNTIGFLRAGARAWPLLEEVFDWQRIDELLRADRSG
jgi:hypothetical protein